MKILIYTHEFPPFLGGLATTSYKLARVISEAGLEVAALVPSYSFKDGEIDKTLPYKIARMPLLGKRWVKGVPLLQYLLGWIFLYRALAKEKPEVALFIAEEAEVTGGFIPSFSFKVVHVAGSGITTNFLESRMKSLLRFPMRRLYRKARSVIAVSRSTKELLERVGVPSEKITVIYSGVENYMIHQKLNTENLNGLKKEFGIRENDKILLTVGRLLPRKGQDTVINALPRVIGRYVNPWSERVDTRRNLRDLPGKKR